jgi:phage-related protein
MKRSHKKLKRRGSKSLKKRRNSKKRSVRKRSFGSGIVSNTFNSIKTMVDVDKKLSMMKSHPYRTGATVAALVALLGYFVSNNFEQVRQVVTDSIEKLKNGSGSIISVINELRIKLAEAFKSVLPTVVYEALETVYVQIKKSPGIAKGLLNQVLSGLGLAGNKVASFSQSIIDYIKNFGSYLFPSIEGVADAAKEVTNATEVVKS